jgi:hypothetical protein
LDFDLNNPVEENDENDAHLMDIDLNDIPMPDPDIIPNENAESVATSITISAACIPRE